MDIIEGLKVAQELGLLSEKSDFIEKWRQLDQVKKARISGMLDGAVLFSSPTEGVRKYDGKNS